MDKEIETNMLPLCYIALRVKLRAHTMHNCDNTTKGITFANFRCLLTQRLSEPSKNLRCTKKGSAILSVLTPDDLRFAVMSNDVKAISSAPGIGKKTAEKIQL